MACAILRDGGVIAYPTETLYGLGVDPLLPPAVRRLHRIKGRQQGRPIPFLISDTAMLEELTHDILPQARVLMERYWPGPLTLIFRARPDLPPPLRSPEGTIGLRVSAHPVARGLVQALGGPLAATSANPSGGDDLVDADAIHDAFAGQVDLIIDAGSVPGVSSTVVDVTVVPPRVVRTGMLQHITL